MATQDSLDKLINRLLDKYAPNTMSVMTAEFREMRKKQLKRVVLSTIKAYAEALEETYGKI